MIFLPGGRLVLCVTVLCAARHLREHVLHHGKVCHSKTPDDLIAIYLINMDNMVVLYFLLL